MAKHLKSGKNLQNLQVDYVEFGVVDVASVCPL